MFFFSASYNIILSYMACNTIFLWRSSILGKLDYFCVTWLFSSPWLDQPSLHLDNSHLKKWFQYYPTIIYSFNQISHSYQGVVANNNTTDSSRTTLLFSKECYMHTVYHMFNQCLIVLGFKDAHFFQITICFKRRAAYIKGCYSQNMARCLGRISHYAFREFMCNCDGLVFRCLHIPCVLHLRKDIVKRALHVQHVFFDIEVD